MARIRPPIVLVFVQRGCHFCGEYMRRFRPIADPYVAQGIPVHVGDLSSSPTALRLADQYNVAATPTTIAIGRRGTAKLEGAAGTAEIRKLFEELQ